MSNNSSVIGPPPPPAQSPVQAAAPLAEAIALVIKILPLSATAAPLTAETETPLAPAATEVLAAWARAVLMAPGEAEDAGGKTANEGYMEPGTTIGGQR